MTRPGPRIATEEYPQRWKKVWDLIERNNLDLLIAYADDRAVAGAAHARWLGDFPVHFEPVSILVLPGRDPVLLCGPETEEYARCASRFGNIRVLREFTHPDEDYPFTRLSSLAGVVSALGLNRGDIRRAGIAGRGLMSADLLAAFQSAWPEAHWVDCEPQMCALRAIKSPAEQAVIRHAYQIAEAGIHAAIQAIGPGVSEREVAAEAEAAMRKAGAEGTGIDTIVASGPNSRPILARSGWRVIAARDLVLLTVAPRYEGYHAAIGRPVLVGDPAGEIRAARDAAIRAQRSCAAALAAGIEGRAVEAIGRKAVTDAGLGEYFLYSGVHSVGVIEFEPPIFGPSNPARIEPGMVISIDIPLFHAPWGGLRIEDGYLIHQETIERLNSTPWEIEK